MDKCEYMKQGWQAVEGVVVILGKLYNQFRNIDKEYN